MNYKFYLGYLGIKDNDQFIRIDDPLFRYFIVSDQNATHIGMDVLTGKTFNLYSDEDLVNSLFINASMPEDIPIIFKAKEILIDQYSEETKLAIEKLVDKNIANLKNRIKYEQKGKIITLHKYIQNII